ncbi:non-specific lipid transfer protein GPI-anchored 13-like [Nymphaea colorata]|nr:non-specific lipid transfer protein GPI-anchored 13-like [Nymphaea colorata]
MDRSMVLLALLLLLVSSASALDAQGELEDCINSLEILSPCEAVNARGGMPSTDCCGSYKILKRYWPLCLCTFLREAAIKSSDYYSDHHADLYQAAQICGVPHAVTDCPAVLGLPPDSDDAQMFKLENTHLNVSADAPAGLSSSLKESRGESSLKTYGLGSMVSLMGAVAWALA